VLFDHCAECRRCCNTEQGQAPLEITLTASETKLLGQFCLDGDCQYLGSQGCTLGDKKPFSCSLYPLSYNPQSRTFSFDTECPLLDTYFEQLSAPDSEASLHLTQMTKKVKELEQKDPSFLQANYEIDLDYFELQQLPTKPLSRSVQK
jgi:Fe-S-cluster containining protein